MGTPTPPPGSLEATRNPNSAQTIQAQSQAIQVQMLMEHLGKKEPGTQEFYQLSSEIQKIMQSQNIASTSVGAATNQALATLQQQQQHNFAQQSAGAGVAGLAGGNAIGAAQQAIAAGAADESLRDVNMWIAGYPFIGIPGSIPIRLKIYIDFPKSQAEKPNGTAEKAEL